MSGGRHRDTAVSRGSARKCAVLARIALVTSLALLQAPLRAAGAQDGKPQLVRAEDGKQGVHVDNGKPIAAEVLVVLASGEEGSVDPSLSKVRALKHPPFTDYKSLKLLSRSVVPLAREQAVEVALPNKRTLVLRLVSLLPDGRAKLEVSISRPNRKDYLPLLEVIASSGEPFFVAGQHYEGGTLVLGIRAGDASKLSSR